MEHRKTLSIVLSGILLFSVMIFSTPNTAQAQGYEFGCCQLFIDGKPMCIYPTSSKKCSGEGETYINDGLCDSDSGYCSGYKEEKSKQSEKEN